MYNFRYLSKNSPCRNGQFQENNESHIWGGFVKNLEFTLVIIVVIFPQKDNFGSKMTILKYLGIQPIIITSVLINETDPK